MAALTLTFNDPQTIALLLQYSQFLKQEEGVEGTLQEVAAGLLVGQMDENLAFAQWTAKHKEAAKTAAAGALPALPTNVRQLPAPKAAKAASAAAGRRATA